MKKTTLLLLFIWVLLNQTAANAYSQGITLSFKSAPLSTIFKEIEKQTSFDFIYPADELYARKVTIAVTNAKLEEVMDLCLQGLPFTYSVNEKRIVVKKVEEKVPGVGAAEKIDPIELTGRVVDENGKPVAGATVTVRGTSISTATEADGTFVIKGVDAKATIMITNVGFEPQIVSLRGKTDLSIKLVVTAQEMKEVIISTGFQKISGEKFVGSYSQLDSSSFHRRAGLGIIERLDGTVTGVQFDHKTGLTNSIQIRGLSTINSNKNPLIILDDFPFTGDINNINPNDIESLVVLKDAAAASIWGTRAGNGVIVITSKKAKYNQPLKASFTSNFTFKNKPDLFYFPQISTADFIDLEKFLFENNFYDNDLNNTLDRPIISPVVELLQKVREGKLEASEANKIIELYKNVDVRDDMQKHVYQNSLEQQHFLNLSAGNQFINYQLSFGYNSVASNINTDKKNSQATISLVNSIRPTKKMEITTSINYTMGITKPVSYYSSKLYPYAKLADEYGNSLPIPYEHRSSFLDTVGGSSLLNWQYRPLDELRYQDTKEKTRFMRASINLSYKIFKWVDAEIRYQYTDQGITSTDHRSINTYYTRNMINIFTNLNTLDNNQKYPVPKGGILDLVNYDLSSSNIRGQLNFNHTMNRLHSINGIVGWEMSETKSSSYNSRFYGYDNENGSYFLSMDYKNEYPIFQSITGSDKGVVPNESTRNGDAINRLISVFANATYTFDNRISIYASARRDGANIFGTNTNNKWKPLWSVGSSWEISNEAFFRIPWVSSFRVKGSYGFSGNAGNASALPTIYYQPPLAGSLTSLPYAGIGGAPNPDLRWEEIRMINVGIDFSILKDKIHASMEFYNKKSTDLISELPFDPTTGVELYTVNAASLRGNGFDAILGTVNKFGGITWGVDLGINYNKTKVTKIYNGGYRAQDFITYSLNASEGRLVNGLSSYAWGGLDPLTGDPQGILNGKESKDYTKIFNDSINNQVFHGSAVPLYSGYLSNSISYKGFSLSANLVYRFKFYYRKPSLNYGNLFQNWQGMSEYSNRWKKPGDEKMTNVPSLLYPMPAELAGRDQFYNGSSINVLRGDNIRIQDLRVQYTYFNKGKNNIPIKGFQVYVYLNNLNVILWQKDKSQWDPNYTGGNNFQLTPPPITCTIGASINF